MFFITSYIILFSSDDETNIGTTCRGFQNKNLQQMVKDKTSSQISRIIKRLRVHGLIKNIPCTYRYHVTKLGKNVITMGLKLKEIVIIPKLNFQTAV